MAEKGVWVLEKGEPRKLPSLLSKVSPIWLVLLKTCHFQSHLGWWSPFVG